MKKKIFSFLVFIFFAANLFSQSYNFKIYSIDEGIPQSQVYCMLQDKNDFLWFGTNGGGLAMFDGKQFISYTSTEGLSHDLVLDIAEDKDGKLWIATGRGLSIIKNKKFLTLPAALKPLMEFGINKMQINSSGDIIFATNRGAFIYNGTNLKEIEELKKQQINIVYLDKREKCWFGCNDGAFVLFKDKTSKKYTIKEGLTNNTCTAFLEGKQGEMYIGTANKLNVLQNETISSFLLPAPENAKQNIQCLNYDKKGNMWVGTWDCGNYKIENGKITAYGRSEGMPVDGTQCFLEDKEGNYWFGTDGGGAVKLGVQTFISIREHNGLPLEMVLSMCKTKSGNWWYGNDNGVSFFDGTTYKLFDSKNGITDENVSSIMEDVAGNIWICSDGSGIFKYSNGKFTNYTTKDGLSTNNISAVFQDSKGRIWSGNYGGLNLLEGKRFKSVLYKDGKAAMRVVVIYEDKKNNLWIGTSNIGILKMTENENGFSFENFTEKEGLADNTVLSITEDSKGNIWMANSGGITQVNPVTREVKKITKRNGLVSTAVYALAFADKKNLLIGTNSGIDKIDIELFNKTGKVFSKHFGIDEGFTGVECNTNSVVKEADGKIRFGTVKGVFIYDQKKDITNEVVPVSHIVNLRLFFENVIFSEFSDSSFSNTLLPYNLNLPYNKNHLTFDFVGLSYRVPQKVLYQYMLEGFDTKWQSPAKENFATYSNIPPGKYIFKVKSCNNDGKWNETATTFNFKISPPFWQTWWFRVMLISSLVLGIYILFKWRIKLLKARQKQLKQQVEIKTKELREEKEVVEKQNAVIEKKNQNITSSIRYAKRIQEAILPLKTKLNEIIPESFIFYKPKDIVSGDFYWFTKHKDIILVAAVDCTGHGVPGAFMSLVGNNLLNDIVKSRKITDPSKILNKLHKEIVLALKKGEHESDTVDGMDITLCVIDTNANTLEFSSSGRNLLLVRNNEIKKYKIGKHPLGLVTNKEIRFEKESIELKKGDTIYLYTDGYCDQFGGLEDEKFLDTNFEKLLLKIQNLQMHEQSEILEKEIENWLGKQPQIDDILVIGIKYVWD